MAIKTEKVIKNAEKYVAKGKLEAAIKEYRKVLRENPNDTNTLNRVGDLYARLEKYDEAVKLFTQIAEKYTRDGFFLKAIAIYKKIIKLDPTALAVYERLAELYHRQGLLNEARSQYQVLADYYQKHENATSAITIYQRMSEIEPDNPSHHLKLAELYESQRLTDKALREYQKLVEVMLAAGSVEETIPVYGKAIEFAPDNLDFIRLALGTLHEGGHADAAIKVLERAVELNPGAAEIGQEVGVLKPEVGPEPPSVAVAPAESEQTPEVGPAETGAAEAAGPALRDAWSTEPDFKTPQPGFEPMEGALEIELEDDFRVDDGAAAAERAPEVEVVDDEAATDMMALPDVELDDSQMGSHTSLYDEPVQSFGGDEEVFTLDLDDDEVPETQVMPPDEAQPSAPDLQGQEAAAEDEEFEFEVDLDDSVAGLAPSAVGLGSIDESEIVEPGFGEATAVDTSRTSDESVEIEWSMEGMEELDVPDMDISDVNLASPAPPADPPPPDSPDASPPLERQGERAEKTTFEDEAPP
ncbi:MAG: tetratricopeptide repeat protein, partial [Acidobacteriota bacterium]